MKTLQEDIDDIDRMVDTDAQKDAIRSQIRLVAREVATLEAEFSRLADSHTQLQESLTKAHDENAKLVAVNKQRSVDAWNDMARNTSIEADYSDPGF